mmetsp:Transcript_21752/g.60457  ORF Transcript_21752/g.60457 Transcript_21752/m.60457 type:complete len:274 (-) Transcript_21752:196-1017(-)
MKQTLVALSLPCLILATLLSCTIPTQAFVVEPFRPLWSPSVQTTSTTSTTQRYLMDETETARAAFALCSFGAVGSASLGREAFPIVWNKLKLTQSLQDQGPSQGGPVLELPWYTGYPTQALCERDVQAVLKSAIQMTPAKIIQDYPQPNQPDFFLTYEKFAAALNNQHNPLAVRAVFESLSVNSELVTPQAAQETLQQYQGDLHLLQQNLVQKKVLSYSAVLVLVLILGLADYFALYHLYKGWFPDWPAAVDFPWHVLDSEVGLLAIPKYWIG